MNDTQVKIICNGNLVNDRRGRNEDNWYNPVEVLPPIGSQITYLTFNQGSKEGVMTTYIVDSYNFDIEEVTNGRYKKILWIEVSVK